MDKEKPVRTTGYLLWQAVNRWQRRQKKALQPFGLTPVQFLLLAGLGELADAAGEPVTQAALARHCGTDPMMTSQVLRVLQGQDLVARRSHDGDGRAVALTVTAAGRALVRRAVEAVATSDDAFFAALGADVPAFGNALALLIGEKPRRRVQARRG
jgi:MarR family transcriptional regulator, organic hydroperoxide resistance regulator